MGLLLQRMQYHKQKSAISFKCRSTASKTRIVSSDKEEGIPCQNANSSHF